MRHAPSGRRRPSSEDDDLVRRDGGITGLATLLGPQAFVGILNDALPDAGIIKATPLHARYKPQMNLLMQYRLRTSGGEEALVYAKAYGPDAAPHLEKVRMKPGVPGPLGVGRLALEDPKIVAAVFPNNGRLKQLRRLVRARQDEGPPETRNST